MQKHIRRKILKQIDSWDCLGYSGYGQGRAVTEYSAEEIGQESVCHKVCPKINQCRAIHYKRMDDRFPEIAKIVKKSAAIAKENQLPIVNTVVSAMEISVKRNLPEALRIQEGLRKYQVESMTDHYVYGQLENLEHGLKTEPADSKPIFMLTSAKL